MGGCNRPFCNSSNGGSLNLEDCFELHDSDFALFSGVCTFLLKGPTNRVDDRPEPAACPSLVSDPVAIRASRFRFLGRPVNKPLTLPYLLPPLPLRLPPF